MLMQEEKHTSQAVAFKIDVSNNKVTAEDPEIKKRLEQAAQSNAITLDQIQEKL